MSKEEKNIVKKETVKKEVKKTIRKKKTGTTKKEETLDVVYLLDRSGSMQSAISDTIGGYNSYLEKNRKENVKLTTVMFGDYTEEVYFRKDIKDVEDLTNEKYYARGCTALYDAIGQTINKLDEEKVKKVLFIITTDGLENASKEFNKTKISKMITKHKTWEFMYLGADIDSYSEASNIGIKASRTCNYKKGKECTDIMFDTLSDCTIYMCKSKKLSDNWKDELNDYVEKNKK